MDLTGLVCQTQLNVVVAEKKSHPFRLSVLVA